MVDATTTKIGDSNSGDDSRSQWGCPKIDATTLGVGSERVGLTIALGCLFRDAMASRPCLLSQGRGYCMGRAMAMAAIVSKMEVG